MTKAFTLQKPKRSRFSLVDKRTANLLREQFPYTEVPRILFDGVIVNPTPGKEIWITDTTFRDGQQARAPYKPEQIVQLYDYLHRLGGPNGLIRQCEFFVYSTRDREAITGCQELGHRYPEITGWIRANAEDFKIVKALGLRETGILTSVSDYHIFLKLKKNRRRIMAEYLDIVKAALDEGIVPRCHFEDITRADIYGFCLPFAEELLKLSQQSKIPIKIRLCDTMGYGVTFPGAVLPRSVPRLCHAFTQELGYPGTLLEWHGHNDFHKVHINAVTAWLHGISSLNASLLGYGERTGNPPLEGAIIEYLALKGNNQGIDTTVITDIANYYREVLRSMVPENYPFVGEECNTTRAGIHADGLLKNPEIYSIFDTNKLLKRELKITITDKSGMAGIAQWLNDYLKTSPIEHEPITKRHPGVRFIYEWVMEQYTQGRTSSISTDELIAQAKHYIPSMFESEFAKAKKEALAKGKSLVDRICAAPEMQTLHPKTLEPFLKKLIRSEPSLQFLAITNLDGYQISQVHTQRGDKGLFRPLLKVNFNEKEWFVNVKTTGESYCSDLFFSKFTGRLIITFAEPIRDKSGNIIAVMDTDFKFDELTKMLDDPTA